jgi:hypothetical protein
MSDRPTGTPPGDPQDKPYTYGSDVHGSVSQLIDNAGQVKASYGYNAYGGADSNPNTDTESLTSGDIDNQAPVNPTATAPGGWTPGPCPPGRQPARQAPAATTWARAALAPTSAASCSRTSSRAPWTTLA